jgi:hypothetical protein
VAGDAGVPASGSSRVVRIRTAVVLPAPFGPSRPRTLPARAVKSTPHNARTGPYDFSSPSTTIASSFVIHLKLSAFRLIQGSVEHTICG